MLVSQALSTLYRHTLLLHANLLCTLVQEFKLQHAQLPLRMAVEEPLQVGNVVCPLTTTVPRLRDRELVKHRHGYGHSYRHPWTVWKPSCPATMTDERLHIALSSWLRSTARQPHCHRPLKMRPQGRFDT